MKIQYPRPICKKCNIYEGEVNYKVKGTDIIRYRSLCSKCSSLKRFPYKQYKKKSCEKCGFVPDHTCQLDVDHIDGNHFNNDESNLQTLCANCHRLKTWLAGDHLT